MPIETEIQPFTTWLPPSVVYWLVAVASVAVGGVLIGWLFAAVRQGPLAALRTTGQVLAAGAADLLRLSPRRVLALSWLVVKESIRRPYVLVVLCLFLLIPLHAGWFEPPEIRNPARYYIESMLSASGLLVLLFVLLLSALSLPGDFKHQTLHTVVTKPVRPSEVVLGRILGLTAVGTFLLVIMGPISWGVVVRQLSHRHELSDAELRLEPAAAGQPAIRKGRTSREHGHQHDVVIDASGRGRLQMAQGHWHELTIHQSGGKSTYQIGPPQGQLVARVPIYGKLRFTDPEGKPTEKGVNTGDEWTYRSYIAGGTLASAIWTFDGITEENFPKARFPNGLPLEMTIEVFRTYKGKTDDPENIPGIVGILAVRNPQTGTKVDAKIFEAKEYTTDVRYIPFELQTPEGRTLDLFEDLVADGKLEVWLRCAEPAQYFGVAQPDVYFRARNASFTLNFAKGYLGIWLQMLLVIGLGVMFSTFLSGPIALLATGAMLLAGLVLEFISRLAAGLIPGGGPVEALIRLVTHQNVVSEMEPGARTTVAKMSDSVLTFLLKLVAAVMPAFGRFSFSDYVAYGYDVSANLALQSACRAMAFLLPVFVAGYFFLKLREIAK
jgi:ABC-type transport system involved in multi-copper enzyme maturation permease subunit